MELPHLHVTITDHGVGAVAERAESNQIGIVRHADRRRRRRLVKDLLVVDGRGRLSALEDEVERVREVIQHDVLDDLLP